LLPGEVILSELPCREGTVVFGGDNRSGVWVRGGLGIRREGGVRVWLLRETDCRDDARLRVGVGWRRCESVNGSTSEGMWDGLLVLLFGGGGRSLYCDDRMVSKDLCAIG